MEEGVGENTAGVREEEDMGAAVVVGILGVAGLQEVVAELGADSATDCLDHSGLEETEAGCS